MPKKGNPHRWHLLRTPAGVTADPSLRRGHLGAQGLEITPSAFRHPTPACREPVPAVTPLVAYLSRDIGRGAHYVGSRVAARRAEPADLKRVSLGSLVSGTSCPRTSSPRRLRGAHLPRSCCPWVEAQAFPSRRVRRPGASPRRPRRPLLPQSALLWPGCLSVPRCHHFPSSGQPLWLPWRKGQRCLAALVPGLRTRCSP